MSELFGDRSEPARQPPAPPRPLSAPSEVGRSQDPADRDVAGGAAEPAVPDGDGLVPATGDARVDDALGRLADLAGLPVEEHLGVYEDVHRRLHDALADLDER